MTTHGFDEDSYPELLGDREVKKLRQVVFHDESGAISRTDLSVHTNGDIVWYPASVETNFHGGADVYQLRFACATPLADANGIATVYRLSGWAEIRYLAIGYTHEGAFRHIKISNPSQDEWVEFSLANQDLIFGLQNKWDNPENTEISDVRLYVKGRPERAGASVQVREALIFEEEPATAAEIDNGQSNENAIELLYNYIGRKNVNLRAFAERYLETGEFTVSGDTVLEWKFDESRPERLPDSGTFRYMWHSLQGVSFLLLHARETGNEAAVSAARELTSDWLRESFFQADEDRRYAWYDHGTAERLISLILLEYEAQKRSFDARVMARVRRAIVVHARLLENEGFYAANQPTRFHNHAIFQDIALVAAAATVSGLASSRWLKRGIARLEAQRDALVCDEAGFAVFVENSIAYHHGVAGLFRFAAELAEVCGESSSLGVTVEKMAKWSAFFRYPDGRAPANGDSFRRANPDRPPRVKPVPPSTALLERAGYAVAKGMDGDSPFMICQFATSLSQTHKHEDDLSLTLWFDGVEWLTDPSFYSHEYTNAVPAYLRSAAAHNMMHMDGVPYATTPGHARLAGDADSRFLRTHGESQAQPGWTVTRALHARTDRLELTVEDRANGGNGTDAPVARSLLFHFGDGVEAELEKERILLSHPTSSRVLKISWRPPEINAVIFRGETTSDHEWSMTGLGFMDKLDTYSAKLTFSRADSLQWQIQQAD